MIGMGIYIVITWVHITLNISGKNYIEGTVDNSNARIEFYVDSSMIAKIVNFQMVMDTTDTILEKKGFLIDFKKKKAYFIDFLTGEEKVESLSDEWEYLAETSLKAIGTMECKGFELKLSDSTHGNFNAQVKNILNGTLLQISGQVELLPIRNSISAVFNYVPNGFSNPLIRYMAIPVATGEVILGELIKALQGRIISKGYFMLSMKAIGEVNGRKMFESSYKVDKIEVLPEKKGLPIIKQFIGS